MSRLAERVGFEPTVVSLPRRFSRPVHSTALPPLHVLHNETLALYVPHSALRVKSALSDGKTL